MSGIKSTVEMIYDARSSNSAIIEIKVLGFTYDPSSQSIVADVADYFIETSIIMLPGAPGEPPIETEYQRSTQIVRKQIPYTKEVVNGLFTQFANPIDPSENFTDELDAFTTEALLYVTQQNPVYRVASTGQISTAADWVKI